jgi:glycine cleavage system H protein
VNSDPYGEGWLLDIEVEDAAEVAALMDAEAYKGQLDQS